MLELCVLRPGPVPPCLSWRSYLSRRRRPTVPQPGDAEAACPAVRPLPRLSIGRCRVVLGTSAWSSTALVDDESGRTCCEERSITANRKLELRPIFRKNDEARMGRAAKTQRVTPLGMSMGADQTSQARRMDRWTDTVQMQNGMAGQSRSESWQAGKLAIRLHSRVLGWRECASRQWSVTPESNPRMQGQGLWASNSGNTSTKSRAVSLFLCARRLRIEFLYFLLIPGARCEVPGGLDRQGRHTRPGQAGQVRLTTRRTE